MYQTVQDLLSLRTRQRTSANRAHLKAKRDVPELLQLRAHVRLGFACCNPHNMPNS
jgi:hypothetical protein